jgi:hypothetical protein
MNNFPGGLYRPPDADGLTKGKFRPSTAQTGESGFSSIIFWSLAGTILRNGSFYLRNMSVTGR